MRNSSIAMLLGDVVLSGRDWLIPTMLWMAAAAVLLFFFYSKLNTSRFVKCFCITLKMLGFALLFLCLLEPLWTEDRAKPGANIFAILADNSQGMQIRDSGKTESRGETLLRHLLDPVWQKDLETQFQTRRYVFDERLHRVKSFADLHFDGAASEMLTSLRSLSRRFQGQPLAGILLFSDGNATDWNDDLDLSTLPPIYPVVSGSDDPIRDISIQNVAISETAFEDAPVNVRADVDVVGFKGAKISARLIPIWKASMFSKSSNPNANKDQKNQNDQKDSDDFKNQKDQNDSNDFKDSNDQNDFKDRDEFLTMGLEEQIREAPKDRSRLSFRFQFRPETSGISFYQLQVAVDALAESGDQSEATLANNRRMLVMDRSGGPHRILYVAGRPNWEYKFLNRSLYEDDQVQLVGLIRVATRSPRFEFKGRRGETSNPLFRGFDKQDDLTEQHDQPVLTRLNIRDATELIGGFPKSPEALYEYAAVLIDDLESTFFTRDQLSLLQKYVSERGGGFLALGGLDSFIEGNYAETPVEAMLPVYLNFKNFQNDRSNQNFQNDPNDPNDRNDRNDPNEFSNFRLSLTREGMLEDWLRLRSTEDQERERLDEMPSFKVLSKVGKAKPGAMILMEAIEESTGERHPALAVQRYGKGKTAALMIGDLWRWQMHDASQSGDQAKAWRQMIRWLIADVPQRIEMSMDRRIGDANQAVKIGVRVKDSKFWPSQNANVKLIVKSLAFDNSLDRSDLQIGQAEVLNNVNTNFVQLIAEASSSEMGLYEAFYIPRQTGAYAVEASVNDSNGLFVGSAQAGWSADPASEEFASLHPNRDLMERIARQSGGEVIDQEELLAFTKSLPSKQVPMSEEFSSPLWHSGWCFMLALGCFIAEWGLRRTRGLT